MPAGLDPRTHAYRADLADAALKGQIESPRYASSKALACIGPFVPILDAPDGEPTSELLKGEHFRALEIGKDWSWGWSAHDHYVGYIASCALTETQSAPPLPAPSDPLDIARNFLGMPYVWGGRGGAGIDCSGLVQRSLAGKGVAAPRDSDMQRASLGRELGQNEALRRLDLVFFPGHVGMMADGEVLIHATRYHGTTVEEPLAEVVARVRRKNGGVGILARKRVFE